MSKRKSKFYKSKLLFNSWNKKHFAMKKIHDPPGSLTRILDIVLLIPQALKLPGS